MATLTVVAVALADVVSVDGDTAKSPVNVQYADTANAANNACSARGTAVAGLVTVTYNSNTHYNPGSTVTATLDPNNDADAAGITATGGTAIVPAGWAATNTSGSPTFTIGISTTVPDTAPNGEYTINVTTSGAATQYTGMGGSTQTPVNPFTFNDSYKVIIDCTASNGAPVIDTLGTFSGVEGAAINLTGTAHDPDGDPLTYSWSVTTSGGDAGISCPVTDADSANADASVTCNDDSNPPGTFTVTFSVSDDHGHTTTQNTTLLVTNADPEITGITSPTEMQVFAKGATVNFSADFSDDGTNDTHTCTINWGDTTSSAGTVSESGGAGTCTGSHAYGGANIYTIVVTVADDDGGSDTASVQVVVYDPDAGFVTGGGWIWSPEGAYMADASLQGKATFGFVSKYKKGATVPDGSTEFQFHAAGMNFKSTVYEWLVVPGNKRAQYKGSGTINGAGNYGFLLTLYDGGDTPDQFRIKIWDKDYGDAVVYDSGYIAGSDGIDAGLIGLGAGSIIIHTGGKK